MSDFERELRRIKSAREQEIAEQIRANLEDVELLRQEKIRLTFQETEQKRSILRELDGHIADRFKSLGNVTWGEGNYEYDFSDQLVNYRGYAPNQNHLFEPVGCSVAYCISYNPALFYERHAHWQIYKKYRPRQPGEIAAEYYEAILQFFRDREEVVQPSLQLGKYLVPRNSQARPGVIGPATFEAIDQIIRKMAEDEPVILKFSPGGGSIEGSERSF